MRVKSAISNSNGFSIIELLITVVLLTILITAIIPLYTKAIVTNKTAKNKLFAYEEANKKLEELRSIAFVDLEDSTFTVTNIPSGNGIIDVENVIDGEARTNIAKVTVTVNWNFNTKNESISLSSYITEKGINQ